MSQGDDQFDEGGGGFDVDDWSRLKAFTGAVATLDDVQARRAVFALGDTEINPRGALGVMAATSRCRPIRHSGQASRPRQDVPVERLWLGRVAGHAFHALLNVHQRTLMSSDVVSYGATKLNRRASFV